MGTAALVLLVAAHAALPGLGTAPAAPPQFEPPDYPVDELPFPCIERPCGRLALVDFSYRLADDQRTAQEAGIRFRIAERAFVGGRLGDQRQSVSLSTARLSLGFASEDDGRRIVEGGYRARHFRIEARAERRSVEEGEGWVGEARGALRIGPDFEVLLGALKSEDPEPGAFFRPTPTRSISAGFLWQRGSNLEVSATLSSTRIETAGGIELDRDRVGGQLTYYRSGVQVQGDAAYERGRGRFENEQGFAVLGVDWRIGGHLLTHFEALNRWEIGLKKIERDYRLGLTFFGRQHHFARSGEAAERTVALARRATSLGYNERRAHDLDGRRVLRERLSISGHRLELAEEIAALHRAQIVERNVPQIAVEIARETDDIEGSTIRTISGFVGIPWRPGWPLHRDETSVEYLKFLYSYAEKDFTVGFRSIERRYGLELALNRETNLVFLWLEPGRTPIEVARNLDVPRRIELKVLYAFGQ